MVVGELRDVISLDLERYVIYGRQKKTIMAYGVLLHDIVYHHERVAAKYVLHRLSTAQHSGWHTT